MLRFLHTADWQIGMKASHVGEAGTRVRDERVAAARRVVEAARAAGVEFTLDDTVIAIRSMKSYILHPQYHS